jgi:hypothetical protein
VAERNKAIRSWARNNGFAKRPCVRDGAGIIAHDIVAAYDKAHASRTPSTKPTFRAPVGGGGNL